MKVAIVSAPPEQVLVDKLGWVADGFRAAGHDVRRCHSLADVKAADAECDLLLFDHKAPGTCHNALADLAPSRRAMWVQWWRDLVAFYPDQPFERQPYVESFRRSMRHMDVVLVKERSLLPEYERLGINARWFDQACPADMPACSHSENPEWDVLVLGSASYGQRRSDAWALADSGFTVLWAGLPCGSIPPGVTETQWRHPLKELPELVSQCAVVLGVDWRSDLPGFTSDRTYLATGMGACYVRRAAPEMVDIPSFRYTDHHELIETVRRLVGDYDLRRKTGEAARQCVMEKHTYHNRAEELIHLLEKRQCVSG